MKYKVTAKKKIGNLYINDWFKGEFSHMSYFTDSLSDAKRIISERSKKKDYYNEECEPQLVFANSGKEIQL